MGWSIEDKQSDSDKQAQYEFLNTHGLEALLDKIFGIPETPEHKSTPVIERRTRKCSAKEHMSPTPSDEVKKVLASIDLLQAQLEYANEELKAAKYKCRWLELKVAARDDQLKHVSELFEMVMKNASWRSEATELKRENDLLREQLGYLIKQSNSKRGLISTLTRILPFKKEAS